MKYLQYIKKACSIITILIAVLSIDCAHGQQTPPSPCTDIFQYRFDGSEWFGAVEFRGFKLGETIKLNINLSLKERLPTSYPGSLELFLTREETLKNIFQNKSVLYKIKFPLPAPLPRVTQILINDRIICSGPAEFGQLVTSIALEHTLHTQLAGQQLANNPGSMFQFLIPEGDTGGSFNGIMNGGFDEIYDNNFEKTNQNPNPSTSKRTSPPPQRTTPMLGPSRVSIEPDVTETTNNVSCGTSDPKFNARPLVIGGEEIIQGTWPWLAAIYVINPESLAFRCGGSLISKKVVLSSAHCFYYRSKKNTANEIIVYLGRHNIKDWNEPASVAVYPKEILTHPDYSNNRGSFDADVAIILLKNDVRFTEYIRPVCLWTGPTDNSDIVGEVGVVVGWGRNDAGQLVSHVPNRVEGEIVSNLMCLNSSAQYRELTSDRTFCAGNRDGSGPCTGDSGGGLMIQRNGKWFLRGTVSASLSDLTRNTCNLQEYVIYADIAKFLEWINSHLHR